MKLRILHISDTYWPARNGSAIYFGQVSARFAAEGHSVLVLTTDAIEHEALYHQAGKRISSPTDNWQGVRILRFPVRHLPGSPLTVSGLRRIMPIISRLPLMPAHLLNSLGRFQPWVPSLQSWLKETKEQFDIVGGTNILFASLLQAGLDFSLHRKTPFLIYPNTHLGADSIPGEGHPSPYYTMPHQLEIVRRADAVVLQTPTERKYYELKGVPAGSAYVVGPWVDPDQILGGDGQRFRARHGIQSPIIASIAPMSFDKGTYHLVHAVRKLRAQGSPAELVLAGSVTGLFQRFLKSLPAEDQKHLKILGQVDEETKKDLLAAMDIFAMPSRTDSFGIVYLESWLYRKPVIGARTWGIGDVITDAEDGRLVDFGDVEGLADILRSLLSSPDERLRMGRSGEAKVRERHTGDIKFPMIRSVYEQLACR